MSILSKDELKAELKRPIGQRLTVTPLLDPDGQIGEASIDLRLGNEFILARRPELKAIKILREEKWSFERDLSRYQQRIRKRRGQALILHAGEFALGASLEYIGMPPTLHAEVIGKSSIGRLGLVIATATAVGPGFKGCLTLELCNVGTLPIELYPGVLIAQLVFSRMGKEAEYTGDYKCPTGPQFSKLRQREQAFWRCGSTLP